MRKKLPTLAAALLFAALPALGNMETVFEEDFENPETSKFAEVAKFEPEIATEVAGSKAISGNGSMMFDTRGKKLGLAIYMHHSAEQGGNLQTLANMQTARNRK